MIAASHAPSLFPSSVNSVPLCLALFFRPSTLQTRGGTSPRYRPTLNHPLKRYSMILPLSVCCQLSAVSSPVVFSSSNVDAASSLSPLFATLTKNTGGWGYPRRASHLFALSPFNFRLPALFTLLAVSSERSLEGSGVEGSTACPEARRRADLLSAISFRIRTYAKRASNPFTMNTSKNTALKVL